MSVKKKESLLFSPFYPYKRTRSIERVAIKKPKKSHEFGTTKRSQKEISFTHTKMDSTRRNLSLESSFILKIENHRELWNPNIFFSSFAYRLKGSLFASKFFKPQIKLTLHQYGHWGVEYMLRTEYKVLIVM